MKPSGTWNFKSIVGKVVMMLVITCMIGGISVSSALGYNHHDRGGRHGYARYEHRGYAHHRGDRHYGYGERYYAPPPVIYEPLPPPGISIFLPPIIIRP